MINLSTIKLNPNNPRVIKDDKFRQLVKSIKEFPKMMELRPMVVDENFMVLGGNQRLKALQELGFKEVSDSWVKFAKDLSPEEIKRFILADNISFGEHDWKMLEADWDKEELLNWGLDIPDFAFKGEAVEDDFVVPDEVETDIVEGDLFEIGGHRLLCGDSTIAENVSNLLGGGKPNLMVTDPPYGVKYNADWRNHALRTDGTTISGRAIGKVSNDDIVDWRLAYSLFPGNIIYVWHADRHAKRVAQNIEDSGFVIINQIIWAKNNIVIGRGDYHWKHEPCWYAVRKSAKHNWQGSRKETTLWEIDKPIKSETGHSTQKPVECMARPIINNTSEGDICYDPFVGSGTSIVAGHQLKRKVYAMEIDPGYCQITIDRLLHLDPTLTLKKNGLPYIHQYAVNTP